ncbi:hypothetical protein ACH41H_46435, partial [Streptomyces sp. NPDC020800]|uniref:hypothetical protein n=1 Tax=Streptomyces sp. NPDC020800 TaxID=3365092 RepID=UPI0037A0641C
MVLLKKLRAKNELDWSRPVIDSSHVRAARRGPKAAPARRNSMITGSCANFVAGAPRATCLHELLEVLTKALDVAVCDEAGGEAEEGFVNVVASFP